MLGKCFSILCVISVLATFLTHNEKALADSILVGASKSVTVVISILGLMTLWNGILEVLKEAGVIERLSKLLRPVLKLIFPRAFKENTATEEITACVSANILGLSNATTPLALAAIHKLNEGRSSDKATNDMITLAILGCACFNIIPTTVIAMRVSQGASITYELLVPVWICSFVCMVVGIILCRVIGKVCGDT